MAMQLMKLWLRQSLKSEWKTLVHCLSKWMLITLKSRAGICRLPQLTQDSPAVAWVES